MSESKFVDYYDLLGVTPDADMHTIRAAFLNMAQVHHPDIGGSAEMMQRLNEAYKTLKNPARKEVYDTSHSLQVRPKRGAEQSYSAGKKVNDMSDAEIDEFLDSMFKEFRNGLPPQKSTVKQRLKKMFELE